jgi:membrane fusion protein (multidrug efflux system)
MVEPERARGRGGIDGEGVIGMAGNSKWRTLINSRMLLMLAAAAVLFGGIFGYNIFKERMMKKFMSAGQIPPVTVSAIKAAAEVWQPKLKAVGDVRARQGVEVTCEAPGMVRKVHFASGDEVEAGRPLLQLNADADEAQLRVLEAAVELTQTVYERDQKQYAIQAVSKAVLDADLADLKSKKAQLVQQMAILDKKTIRAPFAGRLGISSINAGQYINPGDKIVTLQSLGAVLVDFYLPQQELSRIKIGQAVTVTADAYPAKSFQGMITAFNPKVDSQTRNVQIEATVQNPRRELLPGMYCSLEVSSGAALRYVTLPRTAVTFNPYGETVFIVEEKGVGPDKKPLLTVRQTFVTLGLSRGDQVAVLKGIKEGDIVVTSGQLKLKSGSPVIINNQVQPSNEAAPQPVDR